MTIITLRVGLRLIVLAMLLPALPASAADRIRVAVASNFGHAMQSLGPVFERRSGVQLQVMTGSTGKLYAQIRSGVQADVFLSADDQRPAQLADDGFGQRDSLFIYALGRLVLWSPTPGFVDAQGRRLIEGGFRHLAMANPDLAPYGRAARDVLETLELWPAANFSIVRGQNIGQTFQFVASGNAELGFVALSQLTTLDDAQAGSRWLVPDTLYTPIRQQAIRLSDAPGSTDFLQFLRSDEARRIIHALGYATE